MALRLTPTPLPPPPITLVMHLHTPRPEIVVVCLRGTVDEAGAALMATKVGQQLGQALHVVLDLGEVQVPRRAGVDVLLELHRAATARGTQLHILGGEQAACARFLQRLHHDRLLCLTDSIDAVIALLPRP